MVDLLCATESLDHTNVNRLHVMLGRPDGETTTEIAQVQRMHVQTASGIIHRFNEHQGNGQQKQPNHKPGKSPQARTFSTAC